MRRNNELIESLSTTISALVVLLFGVAFILGLSYIIVVLVRAILGL